MSRLLVLPIVATIIGILACVTNPTEVLPASMSAPTVETTSNSAPVATFAPTSGPATVPALTAPPGPTVALGTVSVPESTTTPIASALAIPASGLASAPTVAPSEVATIVDRPVYGIDVGKTLPHFEFNLFDGTKRNTAQLSSQGQPVFLFFFVTW